MLDFDYSKHFADIVQTISWDIKLPEDWSDFFEQSGVAPQIGPERRGNQRRLVRVRGLMCFDQPLPSIEREQRLFGVYTKDFSKKSCGLVSPIELYPEEEVRLILPTFRLKLRVAAARRRSQNCYEIGLILLNRFDPDRSAFISGGHFLKV